MRYRLKCLIRLQGPTFQISTIHLWRSTREDYVKLAKLCRAVDNHLAWIIIFSYVRNIQTLLMDVFSLFAEDNSHTISNQLQLYRIAVMVMRVVLVTLSGAFLQDKNEDILQTLLSVPSEIYNQEVQRFVYHVASREIVLTGLNFFTISRNLLLKVASSILIYELVIIQFVQNFREIH
ncbi:gustatory receptor for sugar taste 64f-like isoform X2 [Euwallacea fornicatus]|uniref:gustatory receptor for sugar taste 64f-like isoform X2 n=1 Tax=Euwallacea fornicatus TaxID=995702 RepID=UPI00338E984C